MNLPAIENQNTPSAPAQTRDSRPLKFLLVIAAILAARWIWIAGIGDYGWTYELGMRVLQGEVPFRDYISTLPQMTSYTIVPFLALLKGNLWAFSIHLYLWWLATLLVGLHVARALGLRPATQAAAMFFATCLSLPAVHLGHAYSYAGTFFFGLTLLKLMQHRGSAQTKHLLLAGAFAGLGIFAKQNIGGLTVILGLSVITYDCLMKNEQPLLIRRVFIFGAGAAATFLPIFGYFASKAGASEVFHQMFSDAGAGKGGLFGMLFHVIPLFFFTLETPGRHLWTLLISGLVVLSFLGLIGAKMYRLQKNPVAPTTPTASGNSWRLIGIAIGIVTVLTAVSLLDLPRVADFFDRLHPDAIYACHGFTAPLIYVAYSGFTALAVICLLSVEHWRKPAYFLPIITLPLLLWGHELSYQGYLPYGAPIVVPLAVTLLESIGLIRNTIPLACVAGVLLTVGQAASTEKGYHPPSFRALAALPADSKFAGLRAEASCVEMMQEMHREVSPKIRDQSTLWLTIGGPHLAWGGKPVFSVAALFADTYNMRSENQLMQHWQAQPPQFVFVSDLWPCRGSQILTPEALKVWLPQRYDPVWKSPSRDATLWQLRTQTNNPSR